MKLADSVTGYGVVTRGLHWALAILIAAQLGLAAVFTQWLVDGAGHSLALMLHESIGLVILVLGIAFILWRCCNPKPTLGSLPVWQRVLATLVHSALYAAIVAQPVFGILMSFGFGFSVPFFGLFSLPAWIPVSETAASSLATLHEITGIYIVGGFVGLHIAAAIYHAMIRRDGVLRRMSSARASRSI